MCRGQKGRVRRQVLDRQGHSGLTPWVEKNSICWEPAFPCGAAAYPQLGPHKDKHTPARGRTAPRPVLGSPQCIYNTGRNDLEILILTRSRHHDGAVHLPRTTHALPCLAMANCDGEC